MAMDLYAVGAASSLHAKELIQLMADNPLTIGVACSVLCAEKCADVAD